MFMFQNLLQRTRQIKKGRKKKVFTNTNAQGEFPGFYFI